MSESSESEGEESSWLSRIERSLIVPHDVVSQVLADTSRQLPDVTNVASITERIQELFSMIRYRRPSPFDRERQYVEAELLRLCSLLEEVASVAIDTSRTVQASLDFSRPVLVNT